MISLSGWPRRAVVSVTATTFRPGANRADSACQFGTTLVGATMRNGAPAAPVAGPGAVDPPAGSGVTSLA